MNSTSFGSRLVSSAARSPGRSSTGPEVWRRFTPISRAMMWASVVLPSPGGPNSSTWSSASLRARAAWTKISSWPRTFSCPTYSASVAGRSERSICSSWGEAGLPEISRSVSIAIASGFCQRLQGGADRLGDRQAGRQALHRGGRFLLVVAESQQRVDDVGRLLARRPGCRSLGELALQLEQQPLGGLLADAGDLGERRGVLRGDRGGEIGDRHPREHGERGARADAGDADELAERGALVLRGEAVQRVRVLLDREVREQRDRLAQAGQRIKRA